jgi:hypothetical protein
MRPAHIVLFFARIIHRGFSYRRRAANVGAFSHYLAAAARSACRALSGEPSSPASRARLSPGMIIWNWLST